jgi:hypothetical protein
MRTAGLPDPPPGFFRPAHGVGLLRAPWRPGEAGNPAGKIGLWQKYQRLCRERSPEAADKMYALIIMSCGDERIVIRINLAHCMASGVVLHAIAIQETRHCMKDIADLPSRLPPAERTLPRMLRRQAALYGNRRLLEIGGQAWSFTETLELTARFGGALHAAGIERGDHVAVMCGNRRELPQV